MSDRCPLCALARGDRSEHLTRWFLQGDFGVVVEDLNAKQYGPRGMRLLYVPPEHVECGFETNALRELGRALLGGVAGALEVEEGYRRGEFDLDQHSSKHRDHWHAQLGLWRD